jgi:hypothetical protein
MQINEYKDLIANLAEKTHSFIIKKSNWENEKKVFEDNETLEISRNDLFNLGRKENVNELIKR